MLWLPATKAGTLKIKNYTNGFYSHYQFLSWSYAAALFFTDLYGAVRRKKWFDTINHYVTFTVIVKYLTRFFSLIKVKYRAPLSLVGSNQL